MKPDVKLVILGGMSVGKTAVLHRYIENKFKDAISTVNGAFYLKQWGPYNISIWDTAGRKHFYGLGSLYCRGAAAIILMYDVTCRQSLAELEDLFLSLTHTANSDCIFAVVGNKADLAEPGALLQGQMAEDGMLPMSSVSSSFVPHKRVNREDAFALYNRLMWYNVADGRTSLPAERMCFEISAKTGYNVELLFETLFNLILPSILKKSEEDSITIRLEDCEEVKDHKASCCAHV